MSKTLLFSAFALVSLFSLNTQAQPISPTDCNTGRGAAQAAVTEAENELHGAESCRAISVQIEGPIQNTPIVFPSFHVTVECMNPIHALPLTLNFTAETHEQGTPGHLACVSLVTPTGSFTSHAQRAGLVR
jgi:hypothetical protein